MRSPLDIKSLIAWLEKQPAKQPYDYVNPLTCALAQYLTAAGFKEPMVGGYEFWFIQPGGKRVLRPLPDGWGELVHPLAFGKVGTKPRPQARTFGALLDRARALQCQP